MRIEETDRSGLGNHFTSLTKGCKFLKSKTQRKTSQSQRVQTKTKDS